MHSKSYILKLYVVDTFIIIIIIIIVSFLYILPMNDIITIS